MAALLLGLAALSQAAIIPRQNLPPNETSTTPFSLPNSHNSGARSAQIAQIRAHFQYGPDPLGPGGAYYPKGSYADEMINFDNSTFFAEQIPWVEQVDNDAYAAAVAVTEAGGLNQLSDWEKFYTDGFKTTVPSGPYPGILSNGTSDLLFSMERLSTGPFGLRRVSPRETPAFTISNQIAMNLTTKTFGELQWSGRLFYLDQRNLAQLPLIEGRYAAATDAFFYISPETGAFLPLAIRMNRGSNLVYTPADSATDWLFAKLAFNMNNLWFEQWYHLETTHYLADIVFMAAVRSLDPNHPVYGMLDRLSYQTFAFRLSAMLDLVNAGGPVDKFFFSNGTSASTYGDSLYWTGGAGNWTGTEFTTDLQTRGLINCTWGPALKSFPYYEDASVINSAINTFMTTFVNSYYATDAAVAADTELAAFVAEAGPAKIIDFAPKLSTRAELIALLRHYAMTAGVVHGVSNSNDPVKSTATLPYHPMAFYQPLPTSKGLTDIVPFMPNITQSVGQIGLLAAFNRPWISSSGTAENRTLAYMFDLPSFLNRTNSATQQANKVFMTSMTKFSAEVRSRTFDAQGLSQGMPFIWTVLDPLSTPFYLTV